MSIEADGKTRRAGDAICLVIDALRGALLLASLALVVLAVFFRYVINHSLWFSDDLLTVFFTWLIFLGIPSSLWHDRAPRLEMLSSRFGVTLGESISWGSCLAFFAFVAASAIALFPSQSQTTIATLGVPYTIVGSAVVAGAMLTIVLLVLKTFSRRRSQRWWLGGICGLGGVVALLVLHIPHELAAAVGTVVLLVLGAPIAVALGVAGSAMVSGGDFASITVPAGQMLQGTGHLALLAVPLFMFMGAIIANSRLSHDLADFVQALLGWLPGGTGVACIATACVFANMSGSAVADTAAIGTVFIPQLTERGGYSREDAAALQAAAGVIGVIFPPAIAMILFGTIANIDVIAVFKATIVPGLLVAAIMASITIARGMLTGHSERIPFRAQKLGRSLLRALPVLAIPVILDVGIFSGVFTPSESGAVAGAVALLFVIFMRGTTPIGLWRAIEQAGDGTTLVMFILVCVSILDYGFVTSSISGQLQSLLTAFGSSPLAVLLIVNVLFLVVHVFVETAPSILVMVPLIFPTVLAVGLDPLQLAAVVAVNSTIGLVLPPVGVSLFVASQIAGVKPHRVVRPVLPYVGGSLVALALVTFIPSISSTLPRLWR